MLLREKRNCVNGLQTSFQRIIFCKVKTLLDWREQLKVWPDYTVELVVKKIKARS